MRSNLEGSNIQEIVATGRYPWGIALDLDSRKMYWANRDDGTIARANLDGTGAEVIVTGLSLPRGIALDLVPEPNTAWLGGIGGLLLLL